MSKTILIIATFNNQFDFFSRLVNPLKQLGFKVVFLTNKYSIYKKILRKGYRVFKLRKGSSQREFDVSKVFELVSGELSYKNSKELYSLVYSKIEKMYDKFNFDLIVTWGGVRLIEAAANKFADDKNVKKLCFELGNFPNKLFADPLGTNANSILTLNKDLLLDFKVDEQKYDGWRKAYLEKSLVSHYVPQSSSVGKIDIKKNLFNLIGYKFLRFAKNRPVLTLERIKNKLFQQVGKLNFDEVDLDNDKFMFYPMQVSDDAQLILNSEVDNLKALELASKEAKANGMELFVKPHPGEVKFEFIKKAESLKKELNFKFIDGNTIEILMKAQKVFTINSTVGLQAMVLEKDLQCFGRAFYKDFTQRHLKSYITNYLFDINFWGNEKIEVSQVETLLQRAELGIPQN